MFIRLHRLFKKLCSLKNNKIFNAVKSGDIEKVRELINKGKNIDIVHYDWNWPLVMSAVPYPDILELLIKNGVNIDCQETNKWYSPLINASRLNEIESVKILIKYNANTHLTSFVGFPAIFYAIERNYLKIVKILLKKENNIEFLEDVIKICIEKNILNTKYKELVEKRIIEIKGN